MEHLLVWRRALIDLPVQQASRQLRRVERHTKYMIFLVAFMSCQNRIRLQLCFDFGQRQATSRNRVQGTSFRKNACAFPP